MLWSRKFTQPEKIQELTSANDNRKTIYGFLARTYAIEVTVNYLKELAQKKDLFLASAKDPEAQGTELAEGFRQIAEYASNLKEADLEKARIELAVEYAGLFLGVWRKPGNPSESVYLGAGGVTMDIPRDEVLAIYRKWGVEKAREFKEPEDHIALELQFMTNLSERTSAALKAGNVQEAKKWLEVQRDFLNDHLGKWVPQLTADILKTARREFYKAVAKITEGYVKMDKQLIGELIESFPSEPNSKG